MGSGIQSNDSMFYVRTAPWHELGRNVQEAPNSKEALLVSGLNWKVEQEPIFVGSGIGQKQAEGFIANIRSDDRTILGIVSNRYQIVQNHEAFEFTDLLLADKDAGIKYETAGSLHGGKRVWLLAKMPEIELVQDKTTPYLLFTNSHDGSSAITVCVTPIRVVCQNTLNLAVGGAKRMWSTKHVGDMNSKLDEARMTLQLTTQYLQKLQVTAVDLANQIIDNVVVEEFLDRLIPITESAKDNSTKIRNIMDARDEIYIRYTKAPDLKDYQGTAYGLINAVSDYATHTEPKRKTATWQENRFIKTAEGNDLIDKAYDIIKQFAVVSK